MKREFLQNFKVGDQPLPKEIIDAIMEENGKDIENARKPFSDYEAIKEQLQTAKAIAALFFAGFRPYHQASPGPFLYG